MNILNTEHQNIKSKKEYKTKNMNKKINMSDITKCFDNLNFNKQDSTDTPNKKYVSEQTDLTKNSKHKIKSKNNNDNIIDDMNELTISHIETQLKLKHILETSKINHSTEIMKQSDLKHAHIYCKIHGLSGQLSGPLIENYIKNKYGMSKNNSSSCIGDLQYEKINIEIKVSNGGKDNNKFNFVQIRMNHSCDYILSAYYIDNSNLSECGELFLFKLNKDNIKIIVLKYGGYAHGTIQKLGYITKEDLDNITNNKEYAIRPKYGDKCWNELLTFRIHEFSV